jgi:phage shock protein A
MSILDRLFRVGEAKANTVVDKLEDPVEVSQQILRELNEQLQKGIYSEADIKAIALGHRAEEKSNTDKADEWKQKAFMLMDRSDDAADDVEKAKLNSLAEVAAQNQKDYTSKSQQASQNAQREEASLSVMDKKLKDLRDTINKTKNDVEVIKSQQATANASESINKAMSSIDTDGLVQTMQRMKEKVTSTELRSQAYAEVDDANLSSEKEIDKVLNTNTPTSALDELRKQRAVK